MLSLLPYYELVDDCLRTLQVNLEKAKKADGRWDFEHGSAHIWIDVFIAPQNKGYGYLQVMSPITKIPTQAREEFFKESLAINHQLYGAAFSIFDDTLYIKTIREVQNINLEEAMVIIQRICTYADEYDGYFAQKYDTLNN